MGSPSDPPVEPSDQPHEDVSLADMSAQLGAEAPQRLSVSALPSEFQGLRVKPTFPELRFTQYAGWLLAVICSLVILSAIAWFVTRPGTEDVAGIVVAKEDASVCVKERLGVLAELRKQHLSEFKDMFQLLVATGLIPLFTLLAGYVFGTRQGTPEPDQTEDDA